MIEKKLCRKCRTRKPIGEFSPAVRADIAGQPVSTCDICREKEKERTLKRREKKWICRRCKKRKAISDFDGRKTCKQCFANDTRKCESCGQTKTWRFFHLDSKKCKLCVDDKHISEGSANNLKPSERCVICGLQKEATRLTCRRRACKTKLTMLHSFVLMPPPVLEIEDDYHA